MIKCDNGLVQVKCDDLEHLSAELACLVVTIAKRESIMTNEPIDVTMCNFLDKCWEYLAMEEEAGGKENG